MVTFADLESARKSKKEMSMVSFLAANESSMKKNRSPHDAESVSTTGHEQTSGTIWESYACGRETITSGEILQFLENCGITIEDPRLKKMKQRLSEMNALRKDVEFDEKSFKKMVKGCGTLLMKAIKMKLVIPDFQSFTAQIREIFDECKDFKDGKVADYIPQLALADPDSFAISACTIDGQIFSVGDSDHRVCVQSCSKPIAYLMAAQENSFKKVHNHIGHEPSGVSFNALVLQDFPNEEHPNRRIPHNPMINAGAIMSASLIKNKEPMANRFAHVMDVWERLCNSSVGFSNPVYLSEKDTADRNWCLGFMMQEYHSFPKDGAPLKDNLEFYFQQCSIEASCAQMSIMAATLANGGENPFTLEKIFDPFHVRNCLSLMLTCGMYDYSGEWLFSIGLPSKSGVAGFVWTVIPNKMGIATFSPPLDKNGNSSKGIEVHKELIKRFNFHPFENLRGSDKSKIDPFTNLAQIDLHLTGKLLTAAACGDLQQLIAYAHEGVDLWAADYDHRTALHLAAAEGQENIVQYYIRLAKNMNDPGMCLSFQDRWHRTPLDDANSGGHTECAQLLESAGAHEGRDKTNQITYEKSEPAYTTKARHNSLLARLSKAQH